VSLILLMDHCSACASVMKRVTHGTEIGASFWHSCGDVMQVWHQKWTIVISKSSVVSFSLATVCSIFVKVT
jgi:hypothetical protein